MNGFGRVVLALVGVPASQAYIERDGDTVRVRLGWSFVTTFPVGAIESVAPATRRTVSLGAHGFGGRVLVNGAWWPLAVITLREPVRARLAGIPISVRELTVSVEDPDALRADLVGAEAL
jgi:hypothetical protein